VDREIGYAYMAMINVLRRVPTTVTKTDMPHTAGWRRYSGKGPVGVQGED
jgi:hypothetical protein